MGKILSIKQATQESKDLHEQGKRIVLAGGCFDILHVGHIEFLKASKKLGDHLLLLLESDESIKQQKGEDRPINQQRDRAIVLSNLSFVDGVILLPQEMTNKQYDKVILSIKPAIITTTVGDPGKIHKIRQAEKSHASLIEVTQRIENKSTSQIAKLLAKEI